MRLFDTHCHLDDEQFEFQRDSILANAQSAGVCKILSVGTSAFSSRRCLQFTQLTALVKAAVGIHPNHCHEADEDDWKEIEELATDSNVIAIGETGLDRHWNFAPFDLQQDFFQRHIHLSQSTGKPLVIHMRDCAAELVQALHDSGYKTLKGIMHSFSGDQELLDHSLALGLHISFSGMVTYKKNFQLQTLVPLVPADRILIETDAPYLSPEPVRGVRPNQPAHLAHTATFVAQLRGTTVEELAELATRNAERLFFGA